MAVEISQILSDLGIGEKRDRRVSLREEVEVLESRHISNLMCTSSKTTHSRFLPTKNVP